VSAGYKEWRSELPATLDAVEQLCRGFHSWRLDACAGLNSFSAELLLREALTNSVLHGSLGDSGKRISCSIRAKADRLVIAIRDEGKGFDWRSVWNRHTDPSAVHGRGIEILRHYASLVRFNRTGNSVTIVKRYEATT
jgi:anti-sigma regulatory factor (Ser/Thr protein kinase)